MKMNYPSRQRCVAASLFSALLIGSAFYRTPLTRAAPAVAKREIVTTFPVDKDDSKATLEETVKWLKENLTGYAFSSFHMDECSNPIEPPGVRGGLGEANVTNFDCKTQCEKVSLDKDILTIVMVSRETGTHKQDKSAHTATRQSKYVIPLRNISYIYVHSHDQQMVLGVATEKKNIDMFLHQESHAQSIPDTHEITSYCILAFEQKAGYVERVAKALCHLAKLGRDMPVEKSNEPF